MTNNPAYTETVQMLRDWGQAAKYEHVLKGFNYRMDGVQGAVLGVKLGYLEQWTEARRRNARHYNELLTGTELPLPVEPTGYRHVYHVYAVQVPNRDAIARQLGEAGIGTGIHYPVMEHTDDAVVIPVDMGWNDIGSWSALWDIGDKSEDGNVTLGDVITHDTRNSYIRAEKRLVATVGVDDLVHHCLSAHDRKTRGSLGPHYLAKFGMAS